MNYKFPFIRNISDVLPAIAGRDEFVVSVKDDYTVINYNVMMSDTFPPINVADGSAKMQEERSLHNRLRRECRGIIFDTATGDIIRRPFHKFFNVNEREETMADNIDLSKSHVIMDKLDGSMIAPFIVNGQLIWGSKMGKTDMTGPVEEFVKNNLDYEKFARWCISRGETPIFEWCSRKQRIVLDYPEDRLILTAVRHMQSGNYAPLAHLRSSTTNVSTKETYISLVHVFDPQTNMDEFINYVKTLVDTEGFVMDFGGHKVKLKCDWYVALHKAKEAILKDYNIVELILDNLLDDVKAHLPVEDRDRLTQFETNFNNALMNVVRSIVPRLIAINQDGQSRKDFALGEAQKLDGYVRSIIFKLFDETDNIGAAVLKEVQNTVRNNLSRTSKYEDIRNAWFPGVQFNG